MNRPLDSVDVLSLAHQYPGPLCTQLLADLGARVTLLERPDGGDPQRDYNPWLFRATGANKQSVALDLKRRDDYEVALSLASKTQVIVDGFRPGVLDRLGLGFERIVEINPGVIYCSITGYGQEGPYSSFTGHNINYEAVSGLLAPYVDGADIDDHINYGLPLGDILSGMFAAIQILSQLVTPLEERSPGQHIDVSITDSLLVAAAPSLVRAINGAPSRKQREAGYGVYECSDGHIALGIAFEDEFWEKMCNCLGLEEIAEVSHPERVSQRADLQLQLSGRFGRMSVRQVISTLASAGIPVSPVNALDEVPADPQMQIRRRFTAALDEVDAEFLTVLSPLAPYEADSVPRVPSLGCANDLVNRTL